MATSREKFRNLEKKIEALKNKLGLHELLMPEFHRMEKRIKRIAFKFELESERGREYQNREDVKDLLCQGARLLPCGRIINVQKLNGCEKHSQEEWFLELWESVKEEMRIKKWSKEVRRKGSAKEKKKLEEFLLENEKKEKPIPKYWDELLYALGHCTIETFIDDGITLSPDGKQFENIPHDDTLWPYRADKEFIKFYKQEYEFVKQKKEEREKRETKRRNENAEAFLAKARSSRMAKELRARLLDREISPDVLPVQVVELCGEVGTVQAVEIVPEVEPEIEPVQQTEKLQVVELVPEVEERPRPRLRQRSDLRKLRKLPKKYDVVFGCENRPDDWKPS